MTVEEHDEYQYDVRCNMMTIALHHLRIEPKEFTLADDIVIDSGSPEHMFRNRKEIDHYFTYGKGGRPQNCFITTQLVISYLHN